MKRFLYISALVVLASCAKNSIIDEPVVPASSTNTISANVEDGTKVALNDLSLLWEAGDNIDVMASYTTSKVVYTTEDSGKKATFSGPTVTVTDDQYYVAAYPNFSVLSSSHIAVPIPSSQTYVEEGISKGAMPLLSIGKDSQNMAFKPFGSVLRFNLTSSKDVTVNRITVRGSSIYGTPYFWNDKRLDIKEYWDNQTFDGIINSGDLITLTVPSVSIKNVVKQFNIVVNSKQYSSLEIYVYTDEGDIYRITKSSSTTFAVGEVKDFSTVTLNTPFVIPNINVYYDSDATVYTVMDKKQFTTSVKIVTPGSDALTKNQLADILSNKTQNGITVDLSQADYEKTTFDAPLSGVSVVYTPKNTVTLADHVWLSQSYLKEFHITEGTTTLKPVSLWGAGMVAYKLYIPSTMTSIGSALSGCEQFIITDNSKFYTDGHALFEKAATVGDPARFIAYASGSSDTEYTIPENVTIDTYAFDYSKNLTSLIISDKVYNIGKGVVFQGVSKISSIEFKGDKPAFLEGQEAYVWKDTAIGSSVSGTKTIKIPYGTGSNWTSYLKGLTDAGWVIEEGAEPAGNSVKASIEHLSPVPVNE